MLDRAITLVAQARTLLVVSDFDGTLAGFSTDPMNAPVNTAATDALQGLANLPSTEVGILSGRAMTALRELCPLTEPVIFAGSHGAESSSHGIERTAEMTRTLDAIEADMLEIRESTDALVERKPFQIVFHTARVAEQDPEASEALLARAAESDPRGAHMMRGHNIVEFSVANINKGTWIAAERDRLGADAVVFIGDDTTDEFGFAVLGDDDLSVKVGSGDTRAHERVDSIDDVADVFSRVLEERRQWFLERTLSSESSEE